MKAVVVEIMNNKAAVLSDQGCVVTIKNNGYEIGQEIQINTTKHPALKKITAFAASAAAFVILGTGTWAYATPYSYVSVDVNPSIEYTINRFDLVLSIKAMNDSGEDIMQEVSLNQLKNQTIRKAIVKTVEQISSDGYLKEKIEGGIIITTASEDLDKAEKLAIDLQQALGEEITGREEDTEVEAYPVNLERMEEARELGVTPGKLTLVEKLQASSSDPDSVNVEEWLSKSVKEIKKATKENDKNSTDTKASLEKEEKDLEKAAKEKDKEKELRKRDENKQQKKEETTNKKSDSKHDELNEKRRWGASEEKSTASEESVKGKRDKAKEQSSSEAKPSLRQRERQSSPQENTSLKQSPNDRKEQRNNRSENNQGKSARDRSTDQNHDSKDRDGSHNIKESNKGIERPGKAGGRK